jgi:hypothetical protein
VAGRRQQYRSLIRARRFLPVSIVLAVGVGVLLQGGSDTWTWVLGLVLVDGGLDRLEDRLRR